MRTLITSFALVLLLAATPVLAQSSNAQAQIAALLRQIEQLQAQLSALSGQATAGSSTGNLACALSFARNFSAGATDGTTNGEVSKLQRFLIREGVYPEALVTGYFGPLTSAALQRWQAANGITITTPGIGAFGPKTRAAIRSKCGYVAATLATNIGPCLNLTRTLTIGSSNVAGPPNGEVSRLQSFLAKEGVYPSMVITGQFDQATSDAVQKWQSTHGISITTPGVGVVGPKTRAAMAENCAPVANVNPNSPVTVVSPKAGDVISSGQQSEIQISFGKAFSEKVANALAAGNTHAYQLLAMGLLSERTGKITTLMPVITVYMHSDVIGASDIKEGAFIYPFIPRTAVVGSQWNSGVNPTYLPTGRYKVVVYTSPGAENTIGNISATGDWFTIAAGNQSGVSFLAGPLGGKVFSRGDTVPIHWTLSGADTSFIPRYFIASLVQATPENEQKGDSYTQTFCVLDWAGANDSVTPQAQSLNWNIPSSATGVPADFRPEFDTRYCSITGVPPGKYRIDLRINTCAGSACYVIGNYSSPLGLRDSTGVFEVR